MWRICESGCFQVGANEQACHSFHTEVWLCWQGRDSLGRSVSLCASGRQERFLSARIEKTGSAVAMAANRKRCASFFAAEPGHPDSSLLPPVWPLTFSKRQTSSWTTAKSGQKQLGNFSGPAFFSVSVFWDSPPHSARFRKRVEQSQQCHGVGFHSNNLKPQ